MSRLSLSLVTTCGVVVAGYLQLSAASPARANRAGAPAQAQPVKSHASELTSQRPVVDTYCVTCHNERLKTAGLMLDKMDLAKVSADAEVWEKVVKKLRAGAMPPLGAKRPDKATLQSFVSSLESVLDESVAPNPSSAHPVVHRLNRQEYTNAIRDLLAVEVDGAALLPADESGYGFDNIADVLSVTPGLLERYLIAAQKISRLAIGDPLMRPTRETFPVSRFVVQTERQSEDLPFLTRGGVAISHFFPVDGEYVLRIHLRRALDGGFVKGTDKREQIDIRIDGERVKVFNVGGECNGSTEARCTENVFPGSVHYQSEYQRTADAGLEVRFAAKAGPRVIGIAFAKTNLVKEGAGPERLPAGSSASAQTGEMGVESVDLTGPFNITGVGQTPSRAKIFVCQPASGATDEACARKILTALARKAYRRPVSAPDVDKLLEFYRAASKGSGFDAGIQFALEKLLVSPEFLLRVEDPSRSLKNAATKVSVTTTTRLDDVALASRLAFFLWSSIPDEELLSVAEKGQLSDQSVLRRQVERMLSDPKANALVTNFANQWLYLRDLKKAVPDPRVFPDFDDSMRDIFEEETILFLESQLREDHPITELLTADYTFANERLARFYGIPGVYGSHFRRVQLKDPNRAGLLGQASILTVTSYSTRTSPVVRGKYLLSNILGSPPPPPPPNVPALEEAGDAKVPATMRARMEAHRKNPVCAGCHARMDPLGFALENFNAIGKWRTSDGGAPIDTAGAFPDGTPFKTPAEFRQVLLGHRDEFIETVAEKLLTYALGRGVEYYDMPAVRGIVRESAQSEYRWSGLILGIVKSSPFQMRSPVSADQPGAKKAH